MPDEVAGILTRRLTAARAECFKAGVPFEQSMFVLGGPDGEFMAPERLSRHWAVTVRQLGLVGSESEPPKFHDLRHTFARGDGYQVRILTPGTRQRRHDTEHLHGRQRPGEAHGDGRSGCHDDSGAAHRRNFGAARSR